MYNYINLGCALPNPVPLYGRGGSGPIVLQLYLDPTHVHASMYFQVLIPKLDGI